MGKHLMHTTGSSDVHFSALNPLGSAIYLFLNPEKAAVPFWPAVSLSSNSQDVGTYCSEDAFI